MYVCICITYSQERYSIQEGLATLFLYIFGSVCVCVCVRLCVSQGRTERVLGRPGGGGVGEREKTLSKRPLMAPDN
jgi:hypothetical protein